MSSIIAYQITIEVWGLKYWFNISHGFCVRILETAWLNDSLRVSWGFCQMIARSAVTLPWLLLLYLDGQCLTWEDSNSWVLELLLEKLLWHPSPQLCVLSLSPWSPYNVAALNELASLYGGLGLLRHKIWEISQGETTFYFDPA